MDLAMISFDASYAEKGDGCVIALKAGSGVPELCSASGYSRLDVATTPDWISAFGTVGALFVGLAILNKELKAGRVRAQRDAAEQASQVATWIDVDQSTSSGYTVIVQNGSPLPIYACGVSGPFDEGGSSPAFVPGLIPPRTTVTGTLPWASKKASVFDLSDPLPLTLSFVDSYGQQWRREAPHHVLRPFLPRTSMGVRLRWWRRSATSAVRRLWPVESWRK